MALFVEILYYAIYAVTSIKNWFKSHYEEMYNGQVVRVRRFDITGKQLTNIFYISWLEHFYNIACYLTNATPQYEDNAAYQLAPSTTDYYFYEFSYWNGTKRLVRMQGADIPLAPPPLITYAHRKFLYVGMGNKDHVCDVTDFVNPFVGSFTTKNHITAQDLFYITTLDGSIKIPKCFGVKFNPIIDIEFIMCDEIIEKMVFVGDDVIQFDTA